MTKLCVKSTCVFKPLTETAAAYGPTAAWLAGSTRRTLTASKVDEDLFQRGLTHGVILHEKLTSNLFHGGEERRETDGRRLWDVELDQTMVDIFDDAAWKDVFHVTTEWFHVYATARITTHDLRYQCEAITELALEVLRTAKALQTSIHHDGNVSTQGVTFLHTEHHITSTTTIQSNPIQSTLSSLKWPKKCTLLLKAIKIQLLGYYNEEETTRSIGSSSLRSAGPN